MSLDVRSAKLLDLVDSGAQVEQIGTGCVFTEGPIWDAEGDFLLFSDIPANQMKKWTSDSGITTFRQPSGKSNGLTYDKQKRLIACEHANRRVSRTESDGTVTTIASHYEEKKLNSPNDVVVKSDGNIYFTEADLQNGFVPENDNLINPNEDIYYYPKSNRLNLNFILNWEYRPGSNLYFVLTRSRESVGKDLRQFSDFIYYTPSDNELAELFRDYSVFVRMDYQINI